MAPILPSPSLCGSCYRQLSAALRYRRVPARAISTVSRHGQPFRMAVIGSGPAGFYTAYRVMSRVSGAKVDMYEALPVPFGLVRFGVAPDHPEVKNCQDKFEEVASSPDFTFVGNVSVGGINTHPQGLSVPLTSLLRHYDAVVFAYGASKDRKLGIPGEDLPGVYSAREFVGWYNGLPEHADLAPDLTQGEDAVIIGQGNVALDVARMLLENVDVLRKSDITEAALETLSRSRVKRVHVVGRRGPMQAAFTIKEARELLKLPHVAFHPVDTSLIPEDVKSLPRPTRRLMEVLQKGSSNPIDQSPKAWSLDFRRSPVEFVASDAAAPRVSATKFEETTLSDNFDPLAYVTGTGQLSELPSSVVFRSIGYRSVELPGFRELGIPFDDRRGIIHNDGAGRVLHDVRGTHAAMQSRPHPGLYCSGWVKRGPTGVIVSTMTDAFETAEAIAEDWASGQPFLDRESREGRPAGWQGVESELGSDQGGYVVKWDDWHKIDAVEKERGRALGKEREKITNTADMLAVVS